MGKLIELPVYYSELEWQERRAVREQYIMEQMGLCYWCNKPLKDDPPKRIADLDIDWSAFPDNFLRYPIHLQHCHETDLTEGAVHAYCNAVMWQYHGR
jgi:hypothetical protein